MTKKKWVSMNDLFARVGDSLPDALRNLTLDELAFCVGHWMMTHTREDRLFFGNAQTAINGIFGGSYAINQAAKSITSQINRRLKINGFEYRGEQVAGKPLPRWLVPESYQWEFDHGDTTKGKKDEIVMPEPGLVTTKWACLQCPSLVFQTAEARNQHILENHKKEAVVAEAEKIASDFGGPHICAYCGQVFERGPHANIYYAQHLRSQHEAVVVIKGISEMVRSKVNSRKKHSRDIANELGVPLSKVGPVLRRLVQAGEIKKEGKSRGTVYWVPKHNGGSNIPVPKPPYVPPRAAKTNQASNIWVADILYDSGGQPRMVLLSDGRNLPVKILVKIPVKR